jgi:HEAT repeat protein/TolA-binding protein
MHGLSLFIAAVAAVQATPPAPPAPSSPWSVRMEAELARAQAALAAAAPQLAVLANAYQLAQVEAAAPALAQASAVLWSMAPVLAGVQWDLDEPVGQAPEPWAQEDPADSLYRLARQALNRNNRRAAELFRLVRERHPGSKYAPDAYYYEAFALYRIGSDDGLRAARAALRAQAEQHPNASTHADAEVLLRRVQGALARRGDAEAAEAITEEVDTIAPAPRAVQPPRAPRAPRPPRAARPPRPGRSSDCDDEDDIRVAALNAMLHMDADRALPVLKTVLEKRDEGSTCLRRKAIFLISQKHGAETEDILLDAARRDPDPEVRQQAVFWLSQVGTEKAAIALDSIIRNSTDAELQEKAVFALSQHHSARAAQALRAYAERRDAPRHIREQAIFWLSQHGSAETAEFLKTLFPKLEDDELKEKVLFSFSQMRAAKTDRWLLEVAMNKAENIEIRKKALFWAGQGHAPIADLLALYDRTDALEMREQLIFVYSQRHEKEVVDKLLEIAKSDPDREMRKKALFWLGRSRDPRVGELLLQIINQPEP